MHVYAFTCPCIENLFAYNAIGLRRNPLGSIEVREYSRFLYLMRWPMDKTLHVDANEIGDIGPYDERSPIYALSLIFVDEAIDRSKGLSALKKEEKLFGVGSFIHSGSLVRGERRTFGKKHYVRNLIRLKMV